MTGNVTQTSSIMRFTKLLFSSPILSIVLPVAASALAALFTLSCSNDSDLLTMFVGTYTAEGSTGIYVYSFNENDGSFRRMSEAEADNPSFLAVSQDGTRLYAVNENNDIYSAAVESFAYDAKSHSLTGSGRELTNGEDPCYLSTNGRMLISANYTGGNLSIFNLDSNGVNGPLAGQYRGQASGPDKIRQGQAHVHCTIFTPDGKYLLATDFSADRIMHFKVEDGWLERLENHPYTELDADTGPRHVTFSPDGRFAYVIGELSGAITAMKYNDGTLTKIQVIDADPLDARGSADIHISPDGEFLYASNRLQGDGIAIFKINKGNGTLSQAGYQYTGKHPRNFAITPNGRYVLVACRDSNCIEIYERDASSGRLEESGKSISLSMPVCVIFKQY